MLDILMQAMQCDDHLIAEQAKLVVRSILGNVKITGLSDEQVVCLASVIRDHRSKYGEGDN